MRCGSLCTGFGGLDVAVEAVFGATPAWVSEVDKHACALLEQRLPGVPNVGDLTTADWSSVEPVELVTAGYPCQPFSFAGRRAGADDARHLWPHIRDALRVLRPRLVVLENVAGHLALGFDAVLVDLASLGFDAEWCLVRASDVGAPHRRERLFVLAHAQLRERTGDVAGAPGAGEGQGPERQRVRADAGDGGAADPDPDSERLTGRQERHQRPPRGQPAPRRRDTDGLVTDAADADGAAGGPAWGAGEAVHEPRAVERPGRRDRVAFADAEHDGLDGHSLRRVAGQSEDEGWLLEPEGRNPPAWGPFEPAIRRWERVLGRAAPPPTDERGRLSPRFVEWMMGLSPGWVTDCGLSRTAQLRILGNGVVPQQAAYALAGLLERQVAA